MLKVGQSVRQEFGGPLMIIKGFEPKLIEDVITEWEGENGNVFTGKFMHSQLAVVSEKLIQCIEALKQKNWTIAFAEGISNGRICYQFSSIPKSDSILVGGMVALKDHMKEYFFGIKREVLQQFGGESAEVAELMANNLCQYLEADICVSVTGISKIIQESSSEKEQNSIFVHFKFPDCQFSREFEFIGNKVEVAEQTVNAIAEMIIEKISY